MPSFKVCIIRTRTTREVGYVTIEADYLQAAEEKANTIHELHSAIDLNNMAWNSMSDDCTYCVDEINEENDAS